VRLKLDENLPHTLVGLLSQLGHDVDTVPNEGLAGKDDGKVWTVTQAAGRFLITQDLDFCDERKYTPGTHEGVLLVRLPQPGRSALTERILALFEGEDVQAWAGCAVSATPTKVADSASSLTPANRGFVAVGSELPYTKRIWRRVRNTCVYLGV
jgi:predicted nuclease of predicted toxin-antitoxin system